MPPSAYEITNNDLRELKRVFDFLADFTSKRKIQVAMEPKQTRVSKIQLFKRNPDAVKIVDEAGVELPERVIDAELRRLEGELAQMQAAVDAINATPDADKRITPRDLMQALNFLGKVTDKVRRCAAIGGPRRAAARRPWRWRRGGSGGSGG